MKKFARHMFSVAIAAVLTMNLAACNQQASADPSADGGLTAAAQAGPQYAQVVSVTPVRHADGDHQVCQDVVVNHTEPPKDQHHIAGTAIGAVAGGLLGHMIGHGKGNTLATVAGAVGGGYAGNRIEAAHQHDQVVSSTQHQCKTVSGSGDQIVAYDVTYVYNGVQRTTRMDHDPGNRVEVQQGTTVVSDAR